MSIRPRDLPALREGLRTMWRSDVGVTIWQTEEERRVPSEREPLVSRIAAELHLLDETTLYWVSEDTCALLQNAAHTLPPTKVLEEDFPSDHGFVVFADPIKGLDTDRPDNSALRVRAMLWAIVVHKGRPSIHMEFFDDPTAAAERFAGLPEDVLRELPPLIYLGASSWPLDVEADNFDDYPGYGDHQKASLLEDRLLLHAFCLLIAQKAAEVRLYEPAKKKQRQATRKGYQPSPVRVVDVRRSSRSEPGAEGGTVEWTHRWVVSAHWRRQWYPSQGRHYPKLILPYTKGPEDKPLLAKDTVKVVR